MLWNFHDLTIKGKTNDSALRERWQQAFASRPASTAEADVSCALDIVSDVPPRPSGDAKFRQGDLLEYFVDTQTQIAIAHFPRFGQLRLDLRNGTTQGRIVAAALNTYGVFEDLVAIALSPHLRRRGMFLIHAFAAVKPHRPHPRPLSSEERGAIRDSAGAALLVGDIGAGKTTTGLALLNAGWQLLSNDSPIINETAEVLSYPGLLAAYPETFARFDATARLSETPSDAERKKITVAAESIWPDVWCERAGAGAIFFPQIEARTDHALEQISAPEALRRLLPHAVEQWDREMIPDHLRILRQLVETIPAFVLRLGPNVHAIPVLLADVLSA